MTVGKLGLGLALVVLSQIGCGPAADPAGDAQLDTLRQSRAPLSAAAVAAGGSWEKLTPDQQGLFLKQSNNDEASARKLCQSMGSLPKLGR